MTAGPATHIAELNFGALRYDWDDPRIAPFQNALDRVNLIAQRSPGFVWQMGEDEMERAQSDPAGPFGDKPRTASTLSVWTNAAHLWAFVDKTVHAHFMARAEEWFVPGDRSHLVIWRVPAGQTPTLAEAMARYHHRVTNGDSAEAFGFDWLRARGEIPRSFG